MHFSLKEKQNISKVFKCSLKNFFSPETTKDILKEKEERDREQAFYIINMFMLCLIQDYIHNIVLLRIYCTLPLCKQRDIKKVTRTNIMIWTITFVYTADNNLKLFIQHFFVILF